MSYGGNQCGQSVSSDGIDLSSLPIPTYPSAMAPPVQQHQPACPYQQQQPACPYQQQQAQASYPQPPPGFVATHEQPLPTCPQPQQQQQAPPPQPQQPQIPLDQDPVLLQQVEEIIKNLGQTKRPMLRRQGNN
jgi:hypothetical protein